MVLEYEPLLTFINLDKRRDLPPINILMLGLLQPFFRQQLVLIAAAGGVWSVSNKYLCHGAT